MVVGRGRGGRRWGSVERDVNPGCRAACLSCAVTEKEPQVRRGKWQWEDGTAVTPRDSLPAAAVTAARGRRIPSCWRGIACLVLH